jgi:hypothetical protein
VHAGWFGLRHELDDFIKREIRQLQAHGVTVQNKKLESQARNATPRGESGFLIPWIVEHASPDQRKALFKSAPPLRIVYRLNRRRYHRVDEALLPAG